MVSIEKNSAVAEHILPSNACSTSFFEILFCKVIFTNNFPIKNTIFKNKSIRIVTSSNSVKPFNGQLAFRREFHLLFGRSFPPFFDAHSPTLFIHPYRRLIADIQA